MTGTCILHTSHRGSLPALQGLIDGQIETMIDNPSAALPRIKAGTVRALAVAGLAYCVVEVSKMPTDRAFRERLLKVGGDLVSGTTIEGFRSRMTVQTKRWRRAIEVANIKIKAK